MKTSRDGRRYSWVAGLFWREDGAREGLRLLPISLGAGESPFVTGIDHECCKGSGTSSHAGWAEAWPWAAGLEHPAAAHRTAPGPQALPLLCAGLAFGSNPVQAVCLGSLMQTGVCWASSSPTSSQLLL